MTFPTPSFAVPFRLLFCLAVLLFCPALAHAEDVEVTANLSGSTTTVDEPVRLTVTVTGARNASMPSRIDVPGLDIEFRGKSQQFQYSGGFGMSMSTVITYIVTPEKPGKFTIPAITIEAGGQSYRTSPLPLTVEPGASNPNAGSGGPSGNDDDSKTPQVFAELIVPQDNAYVGEVIPVEVRFYFESGVSAQLNPPGQVPQIDGEGFSKLRFPPARLEQKNIKGKEYRVLAYQTGIVAAKSGDLTIGPASLNFVVALPQKRRPRSLLNDPFADDILNNGPFFSNQRIEREMTLNTEPAKLHIKSLPAPKPPGFAGAVGQFSLQASAKPLKVNTGEPVTFSTVVSGRGNFDLVSAPVLESTAGWRTYPPTGNLKSNDDMGVSGDKTFDIALIPERKNTEIPGAVFVYFDPTQGKYITLRSVPIPIQVEGNAIAAATPTPDAAAPAPSPGSSPAKDPENSLPALKTTLAGSPKSFVPVWKTRGFWALQALPLLLLGALAWPKLSAAFAPDAGKVREKSLRHEKEALAVSLRSNEPATFFPALARTLEIDAALAILPHPAPVGASLVVAALQLSESEEEIAREIFSRRDELTYGGGRGGRELTPEARRRYESVLPISSK